MTPYCFPAVRFCQIGRDALNDCLLAWAHKMGPVRRPTGGWSHGLFHDDQLVAVVATDTLIRSCVASLTRQEAVELSRLCAAQPDLCRVALRLWRAFVFPALCRKHGFRWAISYQDARAHSGNLYRFDGWTRLATSRSGTDSRSGRRGRNKVIWGWRNPDVETAKMAELPSVAGSAVSSMLHLPEAAPSGHEPAVVTKSRLEWDPAPR